MIKAVYQITDRSLSFLGVWIGLLFARLLLAWEFGEAGLEKFNGVNWFADIADRFPYPFNTMPPEFSWFLATWTEIVGAVGLALGLFTRFWATGLIILDLVAWFSVHSGNGYNVCSNGYKLPLIYLALLTPLLLAGPGKLSCDHLFFDRFAKK